MPVGIGGHGTEGSGGPAENGSAPLTRTVEIVNRRGLHARAAAKFVKTADSFTSDIQVTRSGQTVSGRSIMGLMMLAASPGCTIDIAISGPDATRAMDTLVALVAARFEEDE